MQPKVWLGFDYWAMQKTLTRVKDPTFLMDASIFVDCSGGTDLETAPVGLILARPKPVCLYLKLNAVKYLHQNDDDG